MRRCERGAEDVRQVVTICATQIKSLMTSVTRGWKGYTSDFVPPRHSLLVVSFRVALLLAARLNFNGWKLMDDKRTKYTGQYSTVRGWVSISPFLVHDGGQSSL